jgi:hypothetical protein
MARVLIALQVFVNVPMNASRALADEAPSTPAVVAKEAPVSPPFVADPGSQGIQWAGMERLPSSDKPKPASPPPPPKVKVNRTVPKVKPVPLTPIFSETPEDDEFFSKRVFGEPLVPVGGDTSPEENRELAEALNRYFNVRDKEDAKALTTFLEAHPTTAWRSSLLLNLGTVYRGHGRFTKAIEAWKESWDLSKTALDPWGRAVAETAIGNLAMLHNELGHMREMQEILEEVEGRELRGSAAIKIQRAREGEAVLRLQHDMGLPTGPIALDRILEATDPDYKGMPKELTGVHPRPEGFTLAETLDLAAPVGLKLQMAYRQSGEIPVPSVVHLKVDRFAAVTRAEEGKYKVEDPALPLWMSLDGLASEATGYFLIPEGDIPAGWRKVGREEGNRPHNNCFPAGRGTKGPRRPPVRRMTAPPACALPRRDGWPSMTSRSWKPASTSTMLPWAIHRLAAPIWSSY